MVASAGNLLLGDRWWKDQAPVEWQIQCHYPAVPQFDTGNFCMRALQINCRPGSVRAVYQNVILESPANQLTLSARASGDQLDPAAASFLGLLALIDLSTPTSPFSSQDFLELRFDSSRLASRTDEPLLSTAVYHSPAGHNISTVTVMAGCHGYVGTLYLSDMRLLAVQDESPEVEVKGSSCFQRKNGLVEGTEPGHEALKMTKPVYLVGEQRLESAALRDDISLVTQVSMDRLGVLEHTLDHWDMPVSLVIYAPIKGKPGSDDHWQRLYISKKVSGLKLHPESVVSLVYATDKGEQYPINALRNLAVRQARSRYILLADADFQPSPELSSRVLPLMRQKSGQNVVLVVPAFEYSDVPHKSDVVATTKQELMQLIHAQGMVFPFRKKESPLSHSATDYWKWYTASEPFRVKMLSDKYEPYLVVEKTPNFPSYWEKFTGYGMNKISHIQELVAARYEFWVIPDSWLIHVPHRLSSHFADHLQNATYRLANRAMRFEFLNHLRVKYGLPCEKIL